MGKNKHIDLFTDMIPAIDLNIKDLWDASTEEGRKEIIGDLWILNRYISNARTSNKDVMEHYIMTVNEYYNKNWFIIQKHPKLQWLLLCTCSYDKKTTFNHEWIGLSKNKTANTTLVNILAEYHPSMKMCDIQVLAQSMNKNDIAELLTDIGWTTKEIKKFIK